MQGRLIGTREKALVHVARSQLGLSDEEYRGLLGSVGVSSSKELTHSAFSEVMDRLRASGFKPAHSSAKKSGLHVGASLEKEPMLAKIGAILADLSMPWSYADKIVKRMFGVDRLRWCTSGQTRKVLQALIIYQNRKATPKEKTGQR